VEAAYQRPQPSGIEDPVLRELVKDELKLRKKLREIDTLAAKPRGTLDAAQQKKIEQKAEVLQQLGLVAAKIKDLEE
jgi:hypothetical protein